MWASVQGRKSDRAYSSRPASSSHHIINYSKQQQYKETKCNKKNITPYTYRTLLTSSSDISVTDRSLTRTGHPLQKGGVPAAPSGTATLLRLSPNHQFCPRSLLEVTNFRHPRLSWLDGRCVQGPGTYSPRHG
jgi:hypothetical protein